MSSSGHWTVKIRRPKTDVLPLCHATKLVVRRHLANYTSARVREFGSGSCLNVDWWWWCVLVVSRRVAQQEASNCMSAHGIAIIFAPSLLRTTQPMSPIESLRDVSKQATSVLTLLPARRGICCHRVSVRQSVTSRRSLWKWLNIGSLKQRRMIAQGL